MYNSIGEAQTTGGLLTGAAALAAFVCYGIALCATVGAETVPEGFPTRRGPFAFCHAAILANPQQHAEDFAWLANFDALITNGSGLASPDTRETLQGRGCKLFLYVWPNAFYESKTSAPQQDGDWRRELLE